MKDTPESKKKDEHDKEKSNLAMMDKSDKENSRNARTRHDREPCL